MRVPVGVALNARSPLFVNDDEQAAAATGVTCTATSLRTGDDTDLDVTSWDGGMSQPVTGRYAALITPQSATDTLTLTWSGTVSGNALTFTDTVDVVGNHYATLPDFLARLQSKQHVDRGRLIELRDEFANLVLEYRGASWTRELASTVVTSGLFLPHPYASIVSVTDVDGDPVTGWTLDDPCGPLYAPSLSNGPYTVVYEHGLNRASLLARPCAQWVAATVMREDAGSSRDIISSDGGLRYSTPDWNAGRPTGMIDVDQALNDLPDHRWVGVG